MNGSIFQNVPKFEPKLAKISENFEKSGDFAENWTNWIWIGHFFLKNWYLYGSTFNSVLEHPTKTKLEYPLVQTPFFGTKEIKFQPSTKVFMKFAK